MGCLNLFQELDTDAKSEKNVRSRFAPLFWDSIREISFHFSSSVDFHCCHSKHLAKRPHGSAVGRILCRRIINSLDPFLLLLGSLHWSNEGRKSRRAAGQYPAVNKDPFIHCHNLFGINRRKHIVILYHALCQYKILLILEPMSCEFVPSLRFSLITGNTQDHTKQAL